MPFSEEHQMFRRVVRRFVEEEINPRVDGWEEAGMLEVLSRIDGFRA